MNPAYLHLLLNHFPIITTIIGFLMLAVAILRKGRTELTAAALILLVAGALITIPTYRSGKAAEESVEKLEAVMPMSVEDHEEAAETAVWAVGFAGVAAALSLGWLYRKGSAPSWLLILTLVLTAITVALLVRTANLGGLIRHTEIAASRCGLVDAQG